MTRRPRNALLLGAAVALAALAPLAAAGRMAPSQAVSLPSLFEQQIAQIKRHSDVPILIPARLRIYAPAPFPTGGGGTNGWHLELQGSPNCGGANACFIAAFTATRAHRILLRGQRVELRGGRHGIFRPVSCGASCAPAFIDFLRRGVRYEFQVKGGPGGRRAMSRLANSALAAGPR
jgi:hypothetical protein